MRLYVLDIGANGLPQIARSGAPPYDRADPSVECVTT